MKRILIISLFILGLIIPNIDVKAVDVSNEEQLRAAIEQGGDITLTKNIEVTETLEINKDVIIENSASGQFIYSKKDEPLLIVNGSNISLNSIYFIAGWNGEYDKYGNPESTTVDGVGTGLIVRGGKIITDDNVAIFAGNKGIEVNYGNFDLDFISVKSKRTALTVNNSASININNYVYIYSYEGNGIEVNDGSVVNIKSTYNSSTISGAKNAIYLDGGTININGPIGLSSSTTGKGIYINKGVNTVTGGDVLNLGKNFVFSYEEGTTPNFSIYVNSDIKELRATDEKEFMEFANNKLNLEFCSVSFIPTTAPSSQLSEERKATCSALGTNYDGPIESNELGKCTLVYINGVKQNELDASCNPVTDEEENNNQPSQVVEVPSTSAYGSIIIAVLGIICVIVSVFVMRRVTNKA